MISFSLISFLVNSDQLLLDIVGNKTILIFNIITTYRLNGIKARANTQVRPYLRGNATQFAELERNNPPANGYSG